MKKAVLIWEMPLILGTPSNPISHILYHKTAERYVHGSVKKIVWIGV